MAFWISGTLAVLVCITATLADSTEDVQSMMNCDRVSHLGQSDQTEEGDVMSALQTTVQHATDKGNPDYQALREGFGDPDTVTEKIMDDWGTSVWPPQGKSFWPPRIVEGDTAKAIQTTMPGNSRFLLFLLSSLLVCSVICLSSCNRGKATVARCSKGSEEPLRPSPMSAAHGSILPPWMATFGTHVCALSAAITWRHLHRRAVLLHLLRVVVPALLLVAMHWARESLARQFSTENWQVFFPAMLHGTHPDEVVDAILDFSLTVALLTMVMLSMNFFVGHLAAESESGFRRLLHVSGLSRTAYLCATAGVDGILYGLLGTSAMVMVASLVLDVRFVQWTSPVLLVLIVTLSVLAAVVLGYLLHFASPSARLANVVSNLVVFIVLFSAPFRPLGVVVPSAAAAGGQSWRTLALPVLPVFDSLFELVRACSKGRCLQLDDVYSALQGGGAFGPWHMIFGVQGHPHLNPPESLLSLFGLIALQLTSGIVLVLLVDARRHPALHTTNTTQRTDSIAVLEVHNLVHRYGWLHGMTLSSAQGLVLNGVSFAVAPGAMLGLLGPNGAGKTTTIRCITGEEAAYAGSVAIQPHTGLGGACAYIGLCPQETILNEDLTVNENLLCFARIRGLDAADACRHVAQTLAGAGLEEKKDCMPGTLSGGMRRRLAVSCAMVGYPSVAVLDEPTTGLDPISRRGIWGALQQIKAAGGCCLLTTHMLEEAEALCTNLVILRKGMVAAEGSVQQLKEQWGTGYILHVDCKNGEAEQARAFVASLLPAECREPVRDSSQGQLTFKVSSDAMTVGHLFIDLAAKAVSMGVRHWGISQASLEDAYVHIIQNDVRPSNIQ